MSQRRPLTERQKRLLTTIARAGHAARMRDIVFSRADRDALHRLVELGHLIEHPQKVFAFPNAKLEVIIARRLGGLICCRHALERYGRACLKKPAALHIVVNTYPRRDLLETMRNVVVHLRRSVLIDGLGSPVASPYDTLCTFLTCGSELEALVAVDSFYFQHLVSPIDLRSRFYAQRHQPIARLLDRAREGVRSPIETVARYHLENAGAPVEVAAKREGLELDMLLGGLLNIETDGYTYHSEFSEWTKDRERDATLMAAGIFTIRLSYDMVMRGETVARVRAVARKLGVWPEGASQ